MTNSRELVYAAQAVIFAGVGIVGYRKMFLLVVVAFLAFTAACVAVLRRATKWVGEASETGWTSVSAQILISLAVWTLMTVLLLGSTGLSHGPVQYSQDDELDMLCFHLRAWTCLAMFLVPASVLPFETVRFAATRRCHPQWLVVGLFSWIVAFIVIVSNTWFIPTV